MIDVSAPSTWLPKVLIVDDDPVSAMLLGAFLKQEGLIVCRASSGPEARTLIPTENPDLILLDIQMPGEDGIETCRKIKAEHTLADIPIIFLTSTEELATKLQGFEAGAVDYITKPYQSQEVIARIRVHIRARRSMALLTQSQLAQLENLAGAQRAIMPDPDTLPLFKFQVHYHPMHKAGGDFYDALQAGGDLFDYIVADVSGHDADASLVTSALKVLLYQGQSTLNSPQDTLRMINRALIASFPEALYLTLLWVRLNRSRRTVTVLSAGHTPALHVRPGAGSVEALHQQGDVLGMFEDADLAEATFPVLPGDRIVLFTDGLIEVPDGEGVSRSRGLERLSRFCLEAAALPLAAMVPAVVERIVTGHHAIEDDILLMVVEV